MTRLLRTPALVILALAALAPLATAATRAPAPHVRAAAPLNPIVSQSDTFLVGSFGFQDLLGACQPRGWTGEDRTDRVFAHTSTAQLVNQQVLTGLAPASFGPSGTVDLWNGASGSTNNGQSFSETRGADVTVLSPQPLNVMSMTVAGISLSAPSTVGARIYNNPSGTLLASGSVTITTTGPIGPVVVPVSATLYSGISYRVCFYVSSGSGPLLLASLPFTEGTGNLRITALWAHAGDVYPTNTNQGLSHFALNLNGAPAFAGLSGTRIYRPGAVATSPAGHVYFSDFSNGLRMLDGDPGTDALGLWGSYSAPGGSLHSAAYAGEGGVVASDPARGLILEFPGDGQAPLTLAGGGSSTLDTTISDANLGAPTQIAVAPDGAIYFTDPISARVRKIASGHVTTVAGTGSPGSGGGEGVPATSAPLMNPQGIAIDPSGQHLYVADAGNDRVRHVDLLTGLVTTYASGASFLLLSAQAPLTGSEPLVYASQSGRIFRLGPVPAQVAGGVGYGPSSEAGNPLQHLFGTITGLTADGAGGLYFADSDAHLVYHLTSGGALQVLAGIPVAMTMGAKSMWFGADATSDPDEVANWVHQSGYGNGWSQRLVSPTFSLSTHPGAVLDFDAALDLGAQPISATAAAEFMAVQGLKSDGTWAFLNVRLTGAGVPTAPVQTFRGRGLVKVEATLGADGNEALGLAANTRLRIVLQTDIFNSDEDGIAPSLHGALAVDNLLISEDGVPIVGLADFEDGLGGWSTEARNGAYESAELPPFTRDATPGTEVTLHSGVDLQDPSCAWTFYSVGDTVGNGVFARLSSPWFARAPGDSELLIAFSGKLNTIDQARLVRVGVMAKNAGETHPRTIAWLTSPLRAEVSGGDAASPYVNQQVLHFPNDFDNASTGDSIRIVFQVEDIGEISGPLFSLNGRPTTKLPYLDDISVSQLHVDSDHDGVADAFDACPGECAAGQDANGDGCIDATATLHHVESWAAGALPLHYRIASGGDPLNPTVGDTAAIRRGFEHWVQAPNCALTVVEDPMTTQQNAGLDGVNLVTFQDPDFEFPAGVLAVTPTFSFTKRAMFNDEIVLPGQIVDADMIFNPAAHFTTPGYSPAFPDTFDLESVTTHEAGHFYGLSHSGILRATMFFVIQPGRNAASLEPDDQAAIAAAYPAPGFSALGTITGHVTRGDLPGTPAPGALVTAVRMSGATPADSVASDYTTETGAFALRGLAAGNYAVRVTPLDGEVGGFPLTPDYISARVADGAFTTFPAEWYTTGDSRSDDPSLFTAVAVGAGQTVSGIDVVTNADTIPPFITAVSPGRNATGVHIDAPILVSFSERIASAGLSTAFRLHKTGGGPKLGGNALLLNGGRSLVFLPSQPLEYQTGYTLTITSDLTDRAGVPIVPDSTQFTTESQGPMAIADVEPRWAAQGSLISILGGGFDPNRTQGVLFTFAPGYTPIPVPATHVTPTSMLVSVPYGAVAGPIVVGRGPDSSNVFNGFNVLTGDGLVAPSLLREATLPFAPNDVALTPGGTHALAVGSGGLAIVTVATGAVSTRALGASSHLAITPDGRRAIVTQPALGRVLDVDADPQSVTFGNVLATVPVGAPGTPDGVALDLGGRRAYITDQPEHVIYVLDTNPASATRDSVVGEFRDTTAVLTGGVAVLPTGDGLLFCTGNVGSRGVSLDSLEQSADPAGSVVTLTPQATGAVDVTATGGNAIYTGTGVSAANMIRVGVVNGAAVYSDQISLGGTLRDVAISPLRRSALAVNSQTNQLQVVDIDNEIGLIPTASAATGSSPVAISMSGDGTLAAVANFGSKSIGLYATLEGTSLARSVSNIARPGDQVVLQANGDFFSNGSQVDLGSGPFPIGYRLPNSAGASFTVPAGSQRDVSLSALDGGGRRTFGLPFHIVDPLTGLTPRNASLTLGIPPNCVGGAGAIDALTLSPNGRMLAVARDPLSGCFSTVELHDVGGRTFGARLSSTNIAIVGPAIASMGFTTDGNVLWVANTNQAVYLLNTQQGSLGSVIATLNYGVTGEGPGGIATDPFGRYMCVGDYAADTIWFFHPTSFTALGKVGSTGGAQSLVASPDGRYLLGAGGGRAKVINLETLTAVSLSAVHGLTAPGNQLNAVAIASNGKRGVVRFTNGIGVYNLDPGAGAVGSELYFGNPFIAGSIIAGLSPAPDGIGVLAALANHDSIAKLNLATLPPTVTYAPIGQASGTLAPSTDGRRLWIGNSQGGLLGLVKLFDMSAASSLTLVSGGGQAAAPGQYLPMPVRVRVGDAGGRPQEGIAVRFTVGESGGQLDGDSTSVVYFTDANGQAQVNWRLSDVPGQNDLFITALGLGTTLDVTAQGAESSANIAPRIVAFGPPDGATNINTGSPVFVRFNQNMRAAEIESRTHLYVNGSLVAGTFRQDETGMMLFFQPAQPMAFSARCSLAVASGAHDTDGQVLSPGGFSHFFIQSQPAVGITALSPPAGAHGIPVIISGQGFSTTPTLNTVLFNQAPAGVHTASLTELTTAVPTNASTGPVTVQVGSNVSPGANFTILQDTPPISGNGGELPAGPTATKVTITSDGARAYITNPSSNTVTAIDLQTLQTLRVITVGLTPSGIDLTPDDKRAYVCNQNSNDVSVIDIDPASPNYNHVIETIPVDEQPRDLAISPVGPTIYVLNAVTGTVSVIDGNPGNATFDQVTTSTNVGGGGQAIGIVPDGTRAYIVTSGGQLIEMNLTTNAVTTSTNLGGGGQAIGIVPDGTIALVLLSDGRLLAINIVSGSPQQNQVITSINTGGGGSGGGGVQITPDGGTAYVTNTQGNIVFVIDLIGIGTGAVSIVPGPRFSMVKIDSIPVGQSPMGMAIDPSHGAFGLVANSGSGTVTVVGVLHGLAVPVTFDFSPNTLNLKSMGNWVMGTITVPAPYHASDVDISSLRLNGSVAVDPSAPVDVSGVTLKVKFPRPAVELVVSEGDHVPVTVTGAMSTKLITGTDTIRVIRGKVNNPHAGATLVPGQMVNVQWTTPNGVHAQWVAVLHSLDKGLSWILDTTRLPNSGSYVWHVPYLQCDSAKVAVVLVENEIDSTLTQVDGVLGTSDYFHIYGATDVGEIPATLSFAPIRPNPANGSAMFRFGLPRRTVAELDVFDVQGRHVRTLVRGEQPAGWHDVRWNGVTDGGRAGAGIYFVRLRAEGREFKQRIVWLR